MGFDSLVIAVGARMNLTDYRRFLPRNRSWKMLNNLLCLFDLGLEDMEKVDVEAEEEV